MNERLLTLMKTKNADELLSTNGRRSPPPAPPPERVAAYRRSPPESGQAAFHQVSRFLGAPSRYRDRVRDGVFVIGAPSAAAGDRVRSGCDRSRLIEAVLGPLSSAVGTVLPCSMARAIVSRDWAMNSGCRLLPSRHPRQCRSGTTSPSRAATRAW